MSARLSNRTEQIMGNLPPPLTSIGENINENINQKCYCDIFITDLILNSSHCVSPGGNLI